jgi:hypothetical protein
MNNIDTWITENPDAPTELYRPSSRERKTDTYALDHCQQLGQKEDKETTRSIEICSRIHKAAQELLKLCRLPQLEELGKNIIMEELVDKVQDNTSHRRGVTEVATTVTMDLIEQHLIQPTKVHTMVQAFMTTLSKDMQTLDDNMVMHTTTIEELAYHRLVSLHDQLEIWVAYLWDKNP